MELQTVLDWLVRKYPLAKRQTLKRMVEGRRVRVNGRAVKKLSQPLRPEDSVAVIESRQAAPEQNPRLEGVIFEDADLLVLNKPAGLLTSTVPGEPRPTLLARVREYLAAREPDARVGLIHRLDKDASGLLVFSKNDAAYQSLKSQLFRHEFGREYRAVVHGKPTPARGVIDTRLVERADGTVRSTRRHARGERAVTEYQWLASQGKLSLLRVVLQTGRKHQIRVHLSERGIPVVGDRVYGPKDEKAPRLMLAATRLTIRHPRTGDEMTFVADVPEEFDVKEASDAAREVTKPPRHGGTT
jgi:RluA family pseudouridine synthase